MKFVLNIKREAKFVFRQKYVLSVIGALFLLSLFAVWSGWSEMNTQLATIERLQQKDKVDRENVLAKQTNYGSAAYYAFHLTYSEPSNLAFSAIGQRDVYPWKHRVRMLAIEGQIYETDADNPELSFIGRFDFAFLVSVLLPLFLILLLHDLRSSEKEAGRYDLLITTAANQRALWLNRAVVICGALVIAALLPFWVASLISGVSLVDLLLISAVVISHVVFWTLLIYWYTSRQKTVQQNSTHIASVLLSAWVTMSVLIPVASDVVIDRLVTSPKGGDILLTQRESVNDAWDLPASVTWEAFLATHPEWQAYTDMGPSFEWKWYYAFQQVGDQKATSLSERYRKATLEKDEFASRFAWLSPPMLTQRLMSTLAKTDTKSAIEYEQNIRAYHKALRHFYYPLIFTKPEFSLDTMAGLPEFSSFNKNK